VTDEVPTESMQSDQMTADRRRLLKWLIGLAIAIPVALEGATFLGLLGGEFGGDDGLAVGDDLLPATDRTETVQELAVADGRFELTVEVTNTGDSPYGLTVSAVQLSTGESLATPASVGPIDVGASATLANAWDLPAGTEPTALEVVAREYVDDEARIVFADTVSL